MSAINTLLQVANLATRPKPQPQNNGMGFLEYDNYAEDYWGWEGYYGYDGYDDWGYDFGSYDYGNLPYYEPPAFDWNLPSYGNVTGNLGDSGIDWDAYWDSFFSGGDLFIDSPGDYQFTGDFASSGSGTSDLWLPDNFWDWLNDIFTDTPGITTSDPALPGYCPKGTYHPVDNPYTCVPFPDDPTARRTAQQQQKQIQQAAQKAAQQAKANQQKQDQQCPRDPQGRQVWKNPATGKCELVPSCPQGSKFDSTARRCLTPAQAREMYGDNNWLLWLLIALGVIVIVKR